MECTAYPWLMAAGIQSEVQGPQNVCQVEEEQPNVPLIAGPAVQRHREREQNRGGHECEFVHPHGVQTECSVCLLVLRNPYLTTCCGHNFCKECIERVQKTGKCCPLCNAEQFSLTYNRAHDVALKQFEVYCTHRRVGCEWKGKLEMLDNHLNVDPELEKQLEGCVFVEVQCYHDGCGQSFQRQLITKHQSEECLKRPDSCNYCRDYASTLEDVVHNHWPVCKCYPLSCPNYCTPYAFERQNLEDHLKRECPLQEVECEFKYAGCETKLPRKDMPEHLRENIDHMTLLARQNQALAQQNCELMAKLLEKDDQIKQMAEDVQAMRQRMKEIEEVQSEALAQQNQELMAFMEEDDRIRKMVEEMKVKIVEKGQQIEELTEQHRKDMNRLELEMKEQIQRMKQIEEGQVTLKTADMTNLEDRVMRELQQRSTETERRVTAMTKVEDRIVQLENASKASTTEVEELKDRFVAVEEHTITKAEREKLTHQVVTRRDFEGLSRRQDATDSSLKALQTNATSVAEFKKSKEQVLAIEGSVMTKAEHEMLMHQVATKRDLQDKVTDLTQKMVTRRELGDLAQKQDTTSSSLEKLYHRVQIVPVEIVMPNFGQHKDDEDDWYSDGFYTHPQGYKLCLGVDAHGNKSGKSTHVSCYIFLMRGEYDNHLKWPFRGDVTIQLLNQQDNNHHAKTVHFNDKTPDRSAAQVTSRERAAVGWGKAQFITHSKLGYNAATNCQYLMKDCLYFRVKV